MIGKFKENIVRKIENFEMMPVPEIEVARERGLELAKHLIKEGVWNENEEALYMFSLVYDHPEWKEEIIRQVKKYKSFIENPEQLCEKVLTDLKKYEKEIDLPDLSGEIEIRKERIPVYEERIKNLIEYFRPNLQTSNIESVEVVASDTITTENSGRGHQVGTTALIISHSKNLDNFDHEFLHRIINPITEKLAKELSEEEINKIVSFAGDKLKKDYGDYPLSLLNEEIIRTYNNFIKIDDYRQFEKDELRERLFDFYKKYEQVKSGDEKMSFEQYFLENFRIILD